MRIDLSGRLAIVTGGTGELGRTMVRTLAGCGADVVVHYHGNRAMAETLVAELHQQGRRALAVQADVTREADIARLKAQVTSELGDPDVLVNNAVAQGPWKPVLEQSVDEYESQFHSCVLHNVLMCQAFVPAMIERRAGRIIAINTECAMQMGPTMSAYVGGKRGLDGVLRVLAREIGEHGITVNQVAPGWTISDRDRQSGAERQPDYEKHVPLRRRGTDQDIANAVAFLASDLASFITGCYLPVTGGNVMPTI